MSAPSLLTLEVQLEAKLDKPRIQNLRRRPPGWPVRAVLSPDGVRVQHIVGVEIQLNAEPVKRQLLAQPKIEPGDPRLGLAVPKAAGTSVTRNRIKRQLREIWRARLDDESLPAANDYVLVVRPGLPEAAEARGHDWLVARVDEVLGKVAA